MKIKQKNKYFQQIEEISNQEKFKNCIVQIFLNPKIIDKSDWISGPFGKQSNIFDKSKNKKKLIKSSLKQL